MNVSAESVKDSNVQDGNRNAENVICAAVSRNFVIENAVKLKDAKENTETGNVSRHIVGNASAKTGNVTNVKDAIMNAAKENVRKMNSRLKLSAKSSRKA